MKAAPSKGGVMKPSYTKEVASVIFSSFFKQYSYSRTTLKAGRRIDHTSSTFPRGEACKPQRNQPTFGGAGTSTDLGKSGNRRLCNGNGGRAGLSSNLWPN